MSRRSYASKAEFVSDKQKKGVVLAEWVPATTRGGKRKFVPKEVKAQVKEVPESPEKRARSISPTKCHNVSQSPSKEAAGSGNIWSQGDLDTYEGFQQTLASSKYVRRSTDFQHPSALMFYAMAVPRGLLASLSGPTA